ncbi:hypothetical protein CGRA01v4_01246 [Colletotrichum graminicola]|nr:hypothetical protein CGRA01v4_01246 [Colletotrichum graminicola]
MKSLFNTILLITVFFLNSVLCAVFGNNAYNVVKEPSSRGTTQKVFTSGYERGREPVLVAKIDVNGRRIQVGEAWNAKDRTPNRLHLDVMLKSLWEAEGGRLHELQSIVFDDVVNLKTGIAITKARKRLGLAQGTGFVVTEPPAKGTAAAKKLKKSDLTKFTQCWDDLFQSPFGKVARRMANEGGNLVNQFEVKTNTMTFGEGQKLHMDYLIVTFS